MTSSLRLNKESHSKHVTKNNIAAFTGGLNSSLENIYIEGERKQRDVIMNDIFKENILRNALWIEEHNQKYK